jgi:hypothetical protein
MISFLFHAWLYASMLFTIIFFGAIAFAPAPLNQK